MPGSRTSTFGKRQSVWWKEVMAACKCFGGPPAHDLTLLYKERSSTAMKAMTLTRIGAVASALQPWPCAAEIEWLGGEGAPFAFGAGGFNASPSDTLRV